MSGTDLKICAKRKALLETGGNLLILGGPGSGKTTIALVKAATELAAQSLLPGQKILFLSFARATIARVMEQAKVRIPREHLSELEINTYHGFAWSFIQTFGHLLTGYTRLRLLPPPEAAGRVAGVPKDDRPAKLRQLLKEEGILGFDLFASLAADLLEKGPRLCRIISDSYPVIILDEFQDTNLDEWRMIVALGKQSRIISLADAEQRIYEFRGADPARIGQFIKSFSPSTFDFGSENNRSDGTDLTTYGNDLLIGTNIGKSYTHVKVSKYDYYAEVIIPAKYAVLAARQRLIRSQIADWSLAVLVSSKEMMLRVSSCLARSSNQLPEIQHDVLIDPEGPALSAIFIGCLLEGAPTYAELVRKLMGDLIMHLRGCQGGRISQHNLALAVALQAYLDSGSIRGKNRLELLSELQALATARMDHTLSGDPTHDWIEVRRLMEGAKHDALKTISEDSRFIRLLNRGTDLREHLAERWRLEGAYNSAREIVSNALLQEHFSSSTRVWRGIHIMTIHKSKGKEFDEVIIFEGARTGRLLRENATVRDTEQARLMLRVAVTRARQRTTILTPKWASCPLL
ncbi:MAG: ATP-dependent helicase [Terracidiphilus sp.]